MAALVNRRRLSAVLAAMVTTLLAAGPVAAQDPASAAAAQALVSMLESQKLDAIAARVGDDEYVAALFFPGQLLVVRARYAAPAVLNEKLLNKQYRDIYIDLNSASIPESKMLVTDLGADGLRARRERDQPFDTLDSSGTAINFDGNWREDKMSEDEYMKAYTDAEGRYADALQALLAELKKS
ncbi:MAG: hypothetical protein AB7O67_13765 [Vicinamibacterales bacterium]